LCHFKLLAPPSYDKGFMLVTFVSIFATFCKLYVCLRYKYTEDRFTIVNTHFMFMFMAELGSYFQEDLKRMIVSPIKKQ
jgi:hypothetical protein